MRGTLGKTSRPRNDNLLRLLACVALLLSLTANSQIPDHSKPLPPGTLVDVGGYRVHLYCVGEGSPTVMIVGAAFSFDWGLVQPEVAKFTRVCTFDPSGTAWSDPFKTSNPASAAKSTPTCSDRVDEIHRLIVKAPIEGPYILVGFSVGALWERLYAAMYPDNIAGMVIVDHAFLPAGNDTPSHSANSTNSSHGYSPPVLLSKAPMVIGFEDDRNFGKLPKRNQELHRWAISQHPVRPGYEMATDCFSLIESVTGQHAYPLGNTPLTVISTPNEAPGYAELQTKLLALSHSSEQVIAQNSFHMVPIDEPEVIVKAIHKVVDGGHRQRVEPRIP